MSRRTFAQRPALFYVFSACGIAENAANSGIFGVSRGAACRDFGARAHRSAGTLGFSTVFSTVVENFGKRPNSTPLTGAPASKRKRRL
jgi:hypothetical protein